MTNTVSIHQPTFFPWFPFFQKIKEANTFVFLTHCQYEKNGYQNRFDINKKWYTMSTYRGLDPIVEKKYVNPSKDWNKIKKSLEASYGKQLLEEFDDCIQESLCETNIQIITKICKILEINTNLCRDSKTLANSTERLVEICSFYNADVYFSGMSGKQYLNQDLFHERNISLIFQNEKDMVKRPILDVLLESY